MRTELAVFTMIAVSGWTCAETTKTLFNPFTSKLDYITKLDSTTVSTAGAGLLASTQTWTGTNTWGQNGYIGGILYVSTNIPPGVSFGSVNTFINGGNTTNTGGRNFMFGPLSGQNLTTGNSNVCMGTNACISLTTDSNVVCIGDQCGQNTNGAANNVGVGELANFNTTSGVNDTAIGRAALYNNMTGNANVGIGKNACVNTSNDTTLSNLICIGTDAKLDTSGTMAIGSVAEPITDVYMNSINPGDTANGNSIKFHAQDSSGTDKNGGNFTIAGGASSGAGTGGAVIIQISTTAATSSNPNALVSIASFTSSGFTMNLGQHYNTINSTQPALSSCGGSPSVIGTDSAFTITGGSGAGGCTATFSRAFTNVPTCTVTNQSMSVINAMTYTVSASAITISETGLGTSKIDVICMGHD